jgi:hypothetical protein
MVDQVVVLVAAPPVAQEQAALVYPAWEVQEATQARVQPVAAVVALAALAVMPRQQPAATVETARRTPIPGPALRGQVAAAAAVIAA